MKSVLISLLLTTSCVAQLELDIRPRGEEFIRSVNSNIVFTCSAETTGSLSQSALIQMQWFDIHGREIVETAGQGRRMYIESDGSAIKKLYIHVEQEHEGSYTCTATFVGHRQSKVVKLNLYKDITFDVAPSPQNPTQYTDALILCQVSGRPLPSVTWRYLGTRIQTGGRYTQDINGLRIQNITTADDGTYNCRAEVDSDGRYEERPISVIVFTPPSPIQGAPRMFEGEAYQDFSLSCRAAGFPVPQYSFFKNGDNRPIQSAPRILVDAPGGLVTFRPLSKEDAGQYRCIAYNDAGNVSIDMSLRVVVPPIIRSLANVTGVEGESATLVCVSDGDPEPSMAFRKVGSVSEYRMGDNDAGRILMSYPRSGRLELRINALEPDDMGDYKCVSTNLAGNRELTGRLTVNYKPRFAADHPAVAYAWAGKTRNITCKVCAEPAPVFEWLHNDQALDNTDTYRIFKTGRESKLQVTVQESDQSWIFGTYICRAINDYGSTDQQILLRRGMAPDAPRNLRALVVSTTRIVLAVDEPADNGGVEILGYRVTYDQDKSAEFKTGDRMQIENLRPSTWYIFQVRALNEVDYGQAEQLRAATGNVGPPAKIDLMCNPVGDSAYEYLVTWRKPETGGVPISLYEFRYRKLVGEPGVEGPVAAEDWNKRQRVNDPDIPLTYHRLESLTPQSWYQLQVLAFNSISWSPPSDLFVFKTREGEIVKAIPPTAAPVVRSGYTPIVAGVFFYVMLSILSVIAAQLPVHT